MSKINSSDSTKGRYQFNPSNSRMEGQMAAGHLKRKGHELKGIWVYDAPGVRHLQRTCCAGSSR